MGNAPRVLVILVVKDGAAWLARSLASLARQTHPRLGVVAVDNGSTDRSGELLTSALTEHRVIRLERNVGFPGAVARALKEPVASKADYVLLLHDDTALAPNAVAELVKAAETTPGAGVVGPKVLDWEPPHVLREVGMATDRLGYTYTPLEEGEIDQGQHDAPRDVLFVSSAAMLVSRAAWTRVGPPDERLGPAHGDLDFCWRARLAGYRVLVNPAAVVLHKAAGAQGERAGSAPGRVRYLVERAELATVLKNYRLLSLMWVLPLHVFHTLGSLVVLLGRRRFAAAWHLLAAWGWNAAKLPGTVRRRVRVQSLRRVRDRDVERLMAPAGARFRRWALQASSPLVGTAGPRQEGDGEAPVAPLGIRMGSVALAHPAALGLLVALVVFIPAFREVLFGRALEGGALPSFPESPLDLLRAFASGWSQAGLGAAAGATPALVPLSAASFLTLADPTLLARLLVAGTPILAGASCYRAVLRRVREPAAATVAAACYALSSVSLWAASEGRLGAAAFLVAAPWMVVRFGEAFERSGPTDPFRWTLGTAMGLALTASFFPGLWIAALVALALGLMLPGSVRAALRGTALVSAGAVTAAALVFPFALDLARAGGGAAVDAAGQPAVGALLRLSPGPAPGSWAPALFLPVAAVLAFPVAGSRRWTWRAALGAAAALPLAWAAAAGRLPAMVSNPLAFLGVAAACLALLVGLGVAGLLLGTSREAFGYRQVAVGALTTVVGLGLVLQAGQALLGAWAVGENRTPAAWPVVATAEGPPFRVLWLGGPGTREFPPPGGLPNGIAEAGAASVRFAVTGPGGHSISELGLPASGPGYAALAATLRSILSGETRHGGAMLAPFGIRFVVAEAGDLPGPAAARLGGQLDLNLIQTAGGLSIYESSDWLPVAAAVGPQALEAARSADPLSLARAAPEGAAPLSPVRGGWSGPAALAGDGAVLVATQFDSRWLLSVDGETVQPFRAFGWAVGFEAVFPAQRTEVTFGGQWARAAEIGAMTLLWVGAAWFKRRRGGGGPKAGEAPERSEPIGEEPLVGTGGRT